MRRAQEEGLVAADTDLDWTRRVYYALIAEAVHGPDAGVEPDELAGRVGGYPPPRRGTASTRTGGRRGASRRWSSYRGKSR